MSIYAVINSETNICDNVIVWDDVTPWSAPAGHYTVLDNDGAGSIGWTYDPNTGTWSAPPEPVILEPPPGDEPAVL